MTQVAVGNQIWNYQEIGSGKGSPLLILHGWGRNGNEWVQMANEMSHRSGRRTFVLDLPGFGGSSLPKVENIFEYSELVAKFCKYMDLRKVILMGHSLGGRVGIVLGSRYKELVERLVLIDPAGVNLQSTKRVIIKILAALFVWVPRTWRQTIVRPLMDEDYINAPALHDLYRAVVSNDLRECLPRIQCQTWIIWGEKDPILPITLTDIYKKLLPHPVVRVIWGAGHDPHLSHYLVLKRVLEEAVWI